MLTQLRLYRNAASLETLHFGTITETVNRLIPNVIREMKGFISSFASHQPAIQFTEKQKEFIKALVGHSYIDLSPLYVFVPEGLAVSYKAYSEALEKGVQFIEKLPTEINDYKGFISRILSNADELKSTNYLNFQFESVEKELEAVAEVAAKCFKKNDTTTETKYSNVVHNHNEWQTVFSDVNELIMRIEAIDRSKLTKSVQDISVLLDMLSGKVKRKELDEMTPEMLAKIADYTYSLARQLEFYSVTYYRIKTLTECINQSIVKVLGVINYK